METKDIDISEFKADDDERGVLVGYASKFNVLDQQGDIVMPGAFAASLRKKRGRFPFLFSHDPKQPIGQITEAEEDRRGLKIRVKLALGVQRAQEVYTLMKEGILKGLSIGFRTVKEGVDKTRKARLLEELDLWEVSAVVFPANVQATVTGVKDDAFVWGDVDDHDTDDEITRAFAWLADFQEERKSTSVKSQVTDNGAPFAWIAELQNKAQVSSPRIEFIEAARTELHTETLRLADKAYAFAMDVLKLPRDRYPMKFCRPRGQHDFTAKTAFRSESDVLGQFTVRDRSLWLRTDRLDRLTDVVATVFHEAGHALEFAQLGRLSGSEQLAEAAEQKLFAGWKESPEGWRCYKELAGR